MEHNSNHQNSQDLDDLRRIVRANCESLAVELLGQPTEADRRDLRWNSTYDLALTVSGPKRGLWYDFGSGEGGDMVDLVARELNCSAGAALLWLRMAVGRPLPASKPYSRNSRDGDRSLEERIEAARATYGNGRKGKGTLAEVYFSQRGLEVPDSVWPEIRFSPSLRFQKSELPLPAVLLPFRDLASMEVCGIHKIALSGDGSAFRHPDTAKKLKISGGRVKAAAMVLAPIRNGTLAICEGFETALGCLMGGLHDGGGMYALSGAAMIAEFAPISGVERLIICADNDRSQTGQRAAKAARDLWINSDVDIVTPPGAGDDFADYYGRKS